MDNYKGVSFADEFKSFASANTIIVNCQLSIVNYHFV